MSPPRAAVVLTTVEDLEGLVVFLFLAFVFGVALLAWGLAPIWDRPYVEPSPIPRASIAGTVDLEPRRRRRPPTTREALRIVIGCVVLIFAAALAYEAYAL